MASDKMVSDLSHILDLLTNDTDGDLATTEIFTDYPEGLLSFAYALSVVFMLIGIPANLITIVALAVCKKFRNATAIFIINLHISNLIFCCVVLPMTAVTYNSKHWILGSTMCKIYPMMKYVLNCAAHFTVVAITINRYIIICYPQMYPRLYKRKVLIMSLISIWVIAISLFLPSFFGVWGRFGLTKQGAECTMLADKNNVCPKTFFLVLAFVGPYTIFVVCYSQIWWTVRKAAKNRIGHKTRVGQPTISNSSSDPSAVENGIVCQETATCESGTDEESNNANSIIVLTPEGRENTFKKFIRNTFKPNKNKDQMLLPTRKDKKLATLIGAIMVSFILCYFPIMVVRVAYGEYKSDPTANVLVHLMEYSSVVLSPIIYVIMSSEYKQAYGKLFDEIKSLKLFYHDTH